MLGLACTRVCAVLDGIVVGVRVGARPGWALGVHRGVARSLLYLMALAVGILVFGRGLYSMALASALGLAFVVVLDGVSAGAGIDVYRGGGSRWLLMALASAWCCTQWRRLCRAGAGVLVV